MKRIRIVLLVMLFSVLFGTAISAQAASLSPAPDIQITTANVKYGAEDINNIVNALKHKILDQEAMGNYSDVVWDSEPTSFKTDGSISATITDKVSKLQYTVKSNYVVKQTIWTLREAVVPTILSSDSKNSTLATLMAYINRSLYLDHDTTDLEYTNALGMTPVRQVNSFVSDGNFKYEMLGGKTYTLKQEYEGQTYTKSLTVDAVVPPNPPTITFDKANLLILTDMPNTEYSRDNVSFKRMSTTIRLENNMYGTVYYFRIGATDYISPSKEVQLTIPTREEFMGDAPVINVNTSSGVITCHANGIQYSLDKSYWVNAQKEMTIQESWFGTTMYFRIAETATSLESKIATVVIPSRESFYTAAPNVYINTDKGTIEVSGSNTRQPQWSYEQTTWSNFTSGQMIPSNWYRRVIYFRYPTTTGYFQSAVKALDIPDKQSPPSGSLKLDATSYSITVDNVDSFRLCEFSIDGSNWRTPSYGVMRWDGLRSATSYTVYVRYYGDGWSLASDSLRATVSTLASAADKTIEVKEVVDGNSSFMTLDVVTAPSFSSKTLTGTVNATMLNKLLATAKEVSRTKDVYVTINLSTDSADYTSEITKHVLNIDAGVLNNIAKYASVKLVIEGEFFDFTIEEFPKSGTMRCSVEEITSMTQSKYSDVKDALNSGATVYKMDITGKPSVSYSMPYKMSDDGDLSNIKATYVDTSGKSTNKPARFNPSNRTITFTAGSDSYIMINKSTSSSVRVPFNDVAGSWAYNYITYSYVNNLYKGTTDVTFSPNLNVNRAMIVTLLMRVADVPYAPATGTMPFTDVKSDEWYSGAVVWAVNNRLIVSNGKEFLPNADMTREEIAGVLYNYLKYKGKDMDVYQTAKYSDRSQIKADYLVAVDYLAQEQIMQGTDNNAFSPAGYVTRAEMATILYRLDTI